MRNTKGARAMPGGFWANTRLGTTGTQGSGSWSGWLTKLAPKQKVRRAHTRSAKIQVLCRKFEITKTSRRRPDSEPLASPLQRQYRQNVQRLC